MSLRIRDNPFMFRMVRAATDARRQPVRAIAIVNVPGSSQEAN